MHTCRDCYVIYVVLCKMKICDHLFFINTENFKTRTTELVIRGRNMYSGLGHFLTKTVHNTLTPTTDLTFYLLLRRL